MKCLYKMAERHPGGMKEISRGLSASDTPGLKRPEICTLKGCQNHLNPLHFYKSPNFLAPLQGAAFWKSSTGGSRWRFNPRLFSYHPFRMFFPAHAIQIVEEVTAQRFYRI
jgi:hypothetical protein